MSELESRAGWRTPWVGYSRRFAAVLILGMAAVTWWQVQSGYHQALRTAERLVLSVARAEEEYVRASVRGVDSMLADLAGSVLSKGYPSPELFLGRAVLHPEVQVLFMLDASGQMVFNTLPDSLQRPGLRFDSEPYFLAQRDDPSARRLYVGGPAPARLVGERSFHLSRPILDGAGRFLGVVVAALEPGFFAAYLKSAMLEPEGGAALVHLGGQILARAPDLEATFGTNVYRTDLFLNGPKRDGVERMISPADGVDKLVGYRQLDGYPLMVTSGLSMPSVLADWTASALNSAFILMGLSLALWYFASLSDRRERRRTQALAALADQNDRLEDMVDSRTRSLQQARQQAEERAADLARVNADLEHLTQATAHDLQEPLRLVVSYAQLLQRRYQGRLDAEADEFIGYLVSGAGRMKQLLTDVQRFLSLDRVPVVPRRVDSRRLAGQICDALRPMLDEAGASITVGELPVLQTDERRLRELFLVVLENAVAHARPGVPPEVHVSAESRNGRWVFSVMDNGRGIEPNQQEAIFHLFRRVNPDSLGTGVGLALARKMAASLGGRIWVDSEPGRGSVFHFSVPDPAPAPAEPVHA